MTLRGKRIWLTGASMGIGRAVARELAQRGAVTILTARGEGKLEEVRREAQSRGAKAIVAPGDVTDLERMKEIVSEAESEIGGIDVLIANAGTHLPTNPESFDSAEYLGLMDLNFGGMLRCMEAVLPGMIERGSGRIVGVSSLAGLRGVPTAGAYSASKGAMINFLQSSRFHLASRDVGVTIIHPGFVRTPLTDKNDFHMPFLMDAGRAARIMCNGIARGKAEVSFPIPFSWAVRLLRVMPHPIYNLIMADVWNRMQRG